MPSEWISFGSYYYTSSSSTSTWSNCWTVTIQYDTEEEEDKPKYELGFFKD